MSTLQVIVGTLIILGSMITITLLTVSVRESGAILQDIEDYEEDEPI